MQFEILNEELSQISSVGPIPRSDANGPAINEYLQQRVVSRSDEFEAKTDRFSTGRGQSSHTRSKTSYCLIDSSFRLPELRVPESASLRKRSPDTEELLKRIESDLTAGLETCGGRADVTVPFFERNDPWVFVHVVYTGGSCDTNGIAIYRRDDLRHWISPLKVEREESGRIVNAIERYTAATVHVPY